MNLCEHREKLLDAVQPYQDRIIQLKAENAELKQKVGVAFWNGHTCGRVYGEKAVSEEHIKYCGNRIEDLLAADEPTKTVLVFAGEEYELKPLAKETNDEA